MNNDVTVNEVNNLYNKSCNKCKYFESRTHFCRLNPPSPMVFFSDNKENKYNLEEYTYVSSKFPVISKPDLDYCSYFQINILNE